MLISNIDATKLSQVKTMACTDGTTQDTFDYLATNMTAASSSVSTTLAMDLLMVTYAIVMAVVEHCHKKHEEVKEEAITPEKEDEVMNELDVYGVWT